MRKKNDTLRGTLLTAARSLADTEGIAAVNIRAIARAAGVATGTVYNYFSDKDEILLALTEEYWRKTLDEMQDALTADSFCGRLQEMFDFLRKRIDSSGGMLMRSLGNVETAGQERMASMQTALFKTMLRQIELYGNVRHDIWDETFSREAYARFLMRNMLTLLRERADDLRFLLEIVRRTVF